MKIEEIVWEDHYTTDSWSDPKTEDFVSAILVNSIGYVLKETRAKVVLCSNMGSHGQVFGTITILKKTIKSRSTLREAT